MFKSLKLKTATIAAVTAISTLFIAAPASAATTYYTLKCGWSNYTLKCYYQPVSYTAPTQTAPKPTTITTAPKATTTTAPKSTTSTTATTTGLTAAEQQMLNLVNQERGKAGLAPLKADLELTKLARLKSQDMINKNYFSHQSPTYGSPFDMMKTYGVTYRTAGENIAGNQAVDKAHVALMNSPGHRANILNPNFTHIGIGIKSGGQYGMMFTQMFVGR